MRLALAGQKINSIKALRTIAGRKKEGEYMNGRWIDGGWTIGYAG